MVRAKKAWDEEQVQNAPDPKPGQNVQVSNKGGRGHKSGNSQAARDLPIPGKSDEAKRKRLARATKAATVVPEALCDTNVRAMQRVEIIKKPNP